MTKKQMPADVPMSTKTPPQVGPAAIGGTAGPVTAGNPATSMPMNRVVANDARRGTHNVDNLLPPAAMHSGRGMKS